MPGANEVFSDLSVVVPAYNAQAVICDTLDAIQAYLESRDIAGEVIVVDDGSVDETRALVERRGCGVRIIGSERNRGKGHAVRTGMLVARGAWTLFMDADNSTSIKHVDRFAGAAAGADVLIGSRNLESSRIVRAQPRVRQTMGRMFPCFCRLIALPQIRDSQCGFKLFRQEVIRPIFERQLCDGFCFDVEVLLIASRLGYRIAELPVDWDNPRESTIRVWRDSPRMLTDLMRIAWRHRRAAYASLRR